MGEFLRHAGSRVRVATDVGSAEGAIVFERDARRHRELAEPLLAAGLRVFVDKPLAASRADAEAILHAAGGGAGDGRGAGDGQRAAVASFSALRFLPEVATWRDGAAAALARGELSALWASGPADPDCPHAGARFYGIHTVELVAWALPDPDTHRLDISAHRTEVGASLLRDDGVEVSAHLVDHPDAGFAVGWTGRDGTNHATEVPIGADYYAPATERILAFLAGGPPPVDAAGTVRAVAATDALASAWARARRG